MNSIKFTAVLCSFFSLVYLQIAILKLSYRHIPKKLQRNNDRKYHPRKSSLSTENLRQPAQSPSPSPYLSTTPRATPRARSQRRNPKRQPTSASKPFSRTSRSRLIWRSPSSQKMKKKSTIAREIQIQIICLSRHSQQRLVRLTCWEERREKERERENWEHLRSMSPVRCMYPLEHHRL
jgi:hypothetical protein